MDESVRTGIHRCPDGCSDLPITVFWKEILKIAEH
jgi:hypothetical protein